MTRLQCDKCPWKRSTDPWSIPDGYSVAKHRALKGTISDGLKSIGPGLRLMTCHETDDQPCIGWLSNQLGPGNNLGLRLAAARGRIDTDFRTVGRQHETFEDTLPGCPTCKGKGIVARGILCSACDGTGDTPDDEDFDDDNG